LEEARLLWREVIGDPAEIGKRATGGVDPLEIDADRRAIGGSRAGDGPRVCQGEKGIQREPPAPREIEARCAIRGGKARAAKLGCGKRRLARRAGLERHARGFDPEPLPEESAEETAANDESVAIDSVAESIRPRSLVGREVRCEDGRQPGVAVGEVEGDGGHDGIETEGRKDQLRQ